MCVAAIVPAAGWGFLKPGFPKILEDLNGKTILHTVLGKLLDNGFVSEIVIVVNPNNYGPQIEAVCSGLPVRIAYQEKRTGAAGAVACALPLVSQCDHVLVTYADMPLWRAQTMRMLVAKHLADQATISMVTVTLNGSHRLDRYGRVARDGDGRILAVFEPDELDELDLSLARTVNPSLYCFDRQWLKAHIPRIVPVSKDGFEPEYHLPRLIPMAHEQNRKILEFPLQDKTEALGVNTLSELLDAREILAARNHNHHGGRS